jgi:hypothetical protein
MLEQYTVQELQYMQGVTSKNDQKQATPKKPERQIQPYDSKNDTTKKKKKKPSMGTCKTLYTSLWRLALGYNGNTQPPVRRLENQLLVPPGADEI